ncbi:MAG: HPr family phosphocarrier protein [Clostridiales Family XIII bacterium]|jgi:phosphocarrier protein|nr:HPr family phosphocarrier protein [Clostridiales Family XIII bacterium]
MIQKDVTIIDRIGMHARPASMFSNIAAQCKANIKILFNGNEINAKSIMAVLAAGIVKGSRITIVADGEDEEAAIEKLSALVESNFES